MCTTAFEVKLAFKPNLPFFLSNSRARIPTWTFFPQWLHRSEMLLVNDEFSGVISAFSHSGRTLCGSIFFQAGAGGGGGVNNSELRMQKLEETFQIGTTIGWRDTKRLNFVRSILPFVAIANCLHYSVQTVKGNWYFIRSIRKEENKGKELQEWAIWSYEKDL